MKASVDFTRYPRRLVTTSPACLADINILKIFTVRPGNCPNGRHHNAGADNDFNVAPLVSRPVRSSG